jgi:hypothetical protein
MRANPAAATATTSEPRLGAARLATIDPIASHPLAVISLFRSRGAVSTDGHELLDLV